MADCKSRTQFDSIMQTINYGIKKQEDYEVLSNTITYNPIEFDSKKTTQDYICYYGVPKHIYEYVTKSKRNYKKLLVEIKKLGFKLKNTVESLMCVNSTSYIYTSTKHTRYKIVIIYYKDFKVYIFTIIPL
jgi:hypothetical protein